MELLGFGNASYLFNEKIPTLAQQFLWFCRQFLEATNQPLSKKEIQDLMYVANQFGVKVEAYLSSLAEEHAWGPHIHIYLGRARIHIAVANEAIGFMKKNFNL